MYAIFSQFFVRVDPQSQETSPRFGFPSASTAISPGHRPSAAEVGCGGGAVSKDVTKWIKN